VMWMTIAVGWKTYFIVRVNEMSGMDEYYEKKETMMRRIISTTALTYQLSSGGTSLLGLSGPEFCNIYFFLISVALDKIGSALPPLNVTSGI
jgi:hypothetical protein